MFRTKKELDSHVRDLFSKVSNESDRIEKCIIVAKQYAAIKDFDSAKRYLETYLKSQSPPCLAEAHKLFGDIHLELNEEEKALESYKVAYGIGKNRDALNRVCDLLSQGCGAGDSIESRASWMDLQKTAGGMDVTPKRQNGLGKGQYSTSTFVSRGFTPSPGGPPKSGMNGNLISINTNSKLRNSTTPVKSSNIQGLHVANHTPKQRGMGSCRLQASPERLLMQMSFLEKRYDDVMERIVEQNTLVLNGMHMMREELSDKIKLIQDKVDRISITQDQMLSEKDRMEEMVKLLGKPPLSGTNSEKETQTSAAPSSILNFAAVDSGRLIPKQPSTTTEFESPTPNLFSNLSFSSPGFSDLAKSSAPAGIFGKPLDFKGFGGEGKSLFGDIGNNIPLNVSGDEKTNSTSGGGDGDDDFVPTAEFVPVIPLPALVEVKLGDENENTAFEHRAKIYRFDSELKEWKERGVGNIKILQDKDHLSRVRVLMWRERVLKLACNHWITGDMKVDYYQNNPKILKWMAVDHSDQGSRPEIFTCRFGTEDKCAEFKTRMEEMIELVARSPNTTSENQSMTQQETKVWAQDKTDGINDATKPLSELFKKEEGSWDCSTCYVNNKKNSIKCLSCETAQPGFEAQVVAEKDELEKKKASEAPTFSFGFNQPSAANNLSAVVPPSSFSFTLPKPMSEHETAQPNFQKQAQTSAAPNLIMNFAAADSGLLNSKQPSNTEFESPTPNLFSNLSFSSPGFSDLAKSSPAGIFGKPLDFKGFGGEGKSLFGDIGNNIPLNVSGDEKTHSPSVGGDGDDDFVPTAEFVPVIPLPALVEAKLGDENENTVFEHRAKIYRFDSELKEWKERGLGNIKILQDKDHLSRVRVLMWRERVLKLACNHWITGDMKLDYYQNNPKILKWTAVDHSDQGSRPEIFTCRFGTEDKCAEFKAKMEDMIELVARSPSITPVKQSLSLQESEVWEQEKPNENNDATKPLSELFKKEEGSWDCSTCYVNNKKNSIKCLSCETAQPGFEAQVAAENEELEKKKASEAPKFSFGFTQPSAANNLSAVVTPSSFSFTLPNPISEPFIKEEGSWDCSICYANNKKNSIQCVSCETAQNDLQKEAQTTAAPSSFGNFESPTPNLFSNLSFSSPGFSDLAKSSDHAGIFGKPLDFKGFGGAGKSLFGDLGNNIPLNVSGDEKTNSTSGRGDGDDDFVPTAEFVPVIPLPALVEVKLGDENENTVFEHRAKIYRFDTELKEWKERGVGNIKILQDKDHLSRVRVLMWRERVLKLACNHWITGDMKLDYYQNNPKILKWTAVDHSDQGSRPEIFTCRFGTEDKCAEFKARMEEMIELVARSPSNLSVKQSLNLQESEVWEQKPNEINDDTKPLSELFKKEEGSWDCSTCYVNNGKNAIKCMSCETPHPNSEIGAQTSVATSSIVNFAAVDSGQPIPKQLATNTEFESPTPNFFSNLTFSSPAFSDLAKSSPAGIFGKPLDFKGFGGEGKSLFGDFGSNIPLNVSGDDKPHSTSGVGDGDDDFVPTAEFVPVIPLPALVEVKLGDENENTVFEHRAKIYRFDSELKEWKERGVGNIKILQDKDHLSRVRILMWRERVLKLACNHWITGDMKLDYYQNNPKILKWTAVDHSDQGSRPEIFTCRFGTEDKCAEFKARMEEIIELVARSPNITSVNQSLTLQETEDWEQEKTADATKPLSELFKKEEGSWDCSTCYVNNKKNSIKCLSCETAQPGFEAQVVAEKDELEKKKASEAPTFSFGFNQSTVASNPSPVVPSSSFSFTLPSNGFDFGTSTANTPVLPPTDLKERVEQFQLPDDFYKFETDPEYEKCTGCRGCDPESYEFSAPENKLCEIDPIIFNEILTKRTDPLVIKAAWSA